MKMISPVLAYYIIIKKSFYDFVRRNFDWNWKIGKFVGY